MSVLQVKSLRKRFRSGIFGSGVEVLKGVEFSIEKGTVTGFLGANGAGKTTTIKCLLDLIFPDSGEISFFGKKGLSLEAKRRIGFLPERPYFYDYLTGDEFLQFYGKLSNQFSGQELDIRVDELLERVRLRHAKKKLLRDYSKGMLQRIGVAQALIHRPEFVILDEPMSGLDPDGRYEVQDIIRETANEGTAVFFSSHLLHDAEQLCEHLVVLKEGEVIYTGSTDQLLGRFSSKTQISYSEAGTLMKQSFTEAKDVMNAVDDLRSRGIEIVEIKKERQSLERAFVDMTSEGTSL